MWGQTEYNFDRAGYTISYIAIVIVNLVCAVCSGSILLRCTCDKNAGGERT